MAFVASEAVPFAKTGGLGDVIGALPRAIEREGHTASVFLPAYRCALAAGLPVTPTGITLQISVGTQKVEGTVLESVLPGSGVKVYLIDQPRYFDRVGLYGSSGKDFDDNCERFIFFNRAVLEAILYSAQHGALLQREREEDWDESHARGLVESPPLTSGS